MAIYEGKTVADAIEAGLKDLGLTEETAEIKVLDEGVKGGFLGLGGKKAQVEVIKRESDGKRAAAFLEGLFDLLKVNAATEVKEEDDKTEEQKNIKREKKPATKENIEQAEKNLIVFLDDIIEKIGQGLEYSIMHDEYGLIVQIKGEKSSMFIGHRGETMYAFQTIVSAVANRGISNKVRVVINIENYKEKRVKNLTYLAKKVAKEVADTKIEVQLERMNSYERRAVHNVVGTFKELESESFGEEPNRYVVIRFKEDA